MEKMGIPKVLGAFTVAGILLPWGFSLLGADKNTTVGLLMVAVSGALLIYLVWEWKYVAKRHPALRLILTFAVIAGISIPSWKLAAESNTKISSKEAQSQTSAESTVRLDFKASPALTSEVKHRITQDITRFKKYFVELDIPVPDELPPIHVREGLLAYGTTEFPGQKTYLSEILISERLINDPANATRAYCDYVVGEAVRRPQSAHIDPAQEFDATYVFAEYFNWSFWGRNPPKEEHPRVAALWKIRETEGHDFGDKIAAYALKSIIDSPQAGADSDFDIYFSHKLMAADWIVDGGMKKWPEIDKILEKMRAEMKTRPVPPG